MSTVVHRAIPRTSNAFRERDPRVPFPGIPTTSDGAGMVTWVETHITQGACAYPITSSTTMGGGYETEVANGKKNLWGEELAFVQPREVHRLELAIAAKLPSPHSHLPLARSGP